MSVFELAPRLSARPTGWPKTKEIAALRDELHHLRTELLQLRTRDAADLERIACYLMGLDHRVQALETLLQGGTGEPR